MADAGMSLVLGFIGNEPVHRDNSRALLEDLINAYKRDNKSAKIRFVFPATPFGETMSDLADYCLTSGHQISFVGKASSFDSKEIAPFKAEASGNLYPLNDGISMAKGVVSALSVWAPSAYLILVADPDQDDSTYVALVTAAGMGITVRSLLNGLDQVLLENPEEEQVKMKLVDNDDVFEDVDEEEEPEDEVDYEALGVAADGGDEDAQVQLAEEAKAADIDPDAYGTWAEVADLVAPVTGEEVEEDEEDDEDIEAALDEVDDPENDEAADEESEDEEDEEEEPGGAEDEDGFFDVDADGDEEEEVEPEDDDSEVEEEDEGEDVEDLDVSDESDEEDEPDEEENEEPVATKKAAKKSAAANKAAPRMTEASLIKMGERDKDAFYELAAQYGVHPGRGQKLPIMARKVVEAATGGTPAKKRAPAAKKATAKKTAPAAKKAPAKKAAAAKKAPAKRAATTTRAPARAAASSNGHVDKVTARKLLKLGQEAVALAESLL